MLESDPRTLRLTDTDDIDIYNFGFDHGVEAVRTGVNRRLRLVQGELGWNLDAGVDQDGRILGKAYTESGARAELSRVILGEPSVVEVLSMTLVLNELTRALAVTWSARVEFQDAPVSSNVDLDL